VSPSFFLDVAILNGPNQYQSGWQRTPLVQWLYAVQIASTPLLLGRTNEPLVPSAPIVPKQDATTLEIAGPDNVKLSAERLEGWLA
jgi:hypothetical protein